MLNSRTNGLIIFVTRIRYDPGEPAKRHINPHNYLLFNIILELGAVNPDKHIVAVRRRSGCERL